tara:strand:- start:372 stop:1406 length:1035 start_codon:yes stop_codon:yes gene_type:complete
MKTKKVKNEVIIYEDLSMYKKGKNKVSTNDFTVLNFDNYMDIIHYNFNVKQIKTMCKYYNLKISGCKNELKTRIFNYLKYSYFALKLQSLYRGHLVRTLNKCKGPALFNRKCVNSNDFLMFEKLECINHEQFISFEDEDKFIYGFNLCSLYNLLYVENSGNLNVKNPYNRSVIKQNIYNNINKIIRISKILKLNTNLEVHNDLDNLPFKKKVELNCAKLFQKIDEFGNTTHYNWFYNLSKPRLLKFINELLDIWNYRLSLTNDLKRQICHPNGRPFLNLNIHTLFQKNTDIIKNKLINILRNLVTKGVDKQYKSLGAYYILGALTLVSMEAAQSLPWLYETFRY